MPTKITLNIGEKQHNFLLVREEICQNVEALRQFCYSRFPHLETDGVLRIYWIDQDGDEICVVTDDDFNSFLLAAGRDDNRRLYVEVTEVVVRVDASVVPGQSAPDAATVANRPVHSRIICDVCDQEIMGHRYRCLTCYDYDLCMTCESKYRHKDHIMLRIPQPLRSKTLSHRVLERMERYAAKLDVIAADGDKKNATVEVDGSTDKAVRNSHKARRTEGARSGSDHSYAEGKSKQALLNKAGSSSKSRDQTKRSSKPVKVASDSVKELKRGKTVDGAYDKVVKERPTVPLSWVTDFEHKCRKTRHAHRPSCPYSLEPEAATSLPLESLHCSGQTGTHATEPALVAVARKSCKTGRSVPEPKLSGGTETATSPSGSMVSGLVDGVLKHTPAELKKFFPTDEEMNRVSETLSSLLVHLGLELKMPASETGEASSSAASVVVANAGSTVSEEDANEQQLGEAAVAAADKDREDQSEATVAGEEQNSASEGQLETEHATVAASLKQQNGPAVDNDDTSSASMLTDDEGDDVEGGQVSKQTKSSPEKEVPWILVDLPEDSGEVQQNEDNNSTPPSKPVEPKDQSMDIEESEGEPEVDGADAIRNLIEYTKTRLEMLKKKSTKEVIMDDRFLVIFEKLHDDLAKLEGDQMTEEGKKEKQLKEQQKEKQQDDAGASASEPTYEKKTLPESASTSTTASSSTAPVPPVHTTTAAPKKGLIDSAPAQPAAPLPVYSRRPHVNHAIQTMIAMGFGNDIGRLTRLLEAVNGDIPRALNSFLSS